MEKQSDQTEPTKTKAKYTCNRCGATWESKSEQGSPKYKIPRTCSNLKCKSPYWNKPRIRKTKKINQN